MRDDNAYTASPPVTFPVDTFIRSSHGNNRAAISHLHRCVLVSQGDHRQSNRALLSNLEEGGAEFPKVQVRIWNKRKEKKSTLSPGSNKTRRKQVASFVNDLLHVCCDGSQVYSGYMKMKSHFRGSGVGVGGGVKIKLQLNLKKKIPNLNKFTVSQIKMTTFSTHNGDTRITAPL